MIHVLHGFLGSPADFNFLARYPGIKFYDLLNLPRIQAAPDDVLIGYSMGGRVVLEIASQNNFNFKKIILINAHPGLGKEEEKIIRKDWEDKVLTKMDQENFLSLWNALPLFKHDNDLDPVPKDRLQDFKKCFNRMRLSNQKNYLPEIISNKSKVSFIIGKLDDKYFEMAQERIVANNITCHFVSGGHRLFQHPDELIKIFKQEGIL
jgi:esterase/lipase